MPAPKVVLSIMIIVGTVLKRVEINALEAPSVPLDHLRALLAPPERSLVLHQLLVPTNVQREHI